MSTKTTKLSLNKDAIRVLSSVELHAVVGGAALALGPANANTLSIHCSSACSTKVAPTRAVTTAAMFR